MESPNRLDAERLRYLAQLITPRQTFAVIEMMTHVSVIVSSWFSITLEVFLRRDFGENYLSNLRSGIAWCLLGAFTFFYSLFSILVGGNALAFFAYSGSLGTLFSTGAEGLSYHLFYYAFLSLVIYHKYAIWQRNRRHIQWHSMCFGVSHLSVIPWQQIVNRIPFVGQYVTIDDWFLYRFMEPALCFLIGRVLHPVNGLLSAWLLIGSVCLFYHNSMVYAQERNKALSLMDAAIESSYLGQALAGQPKEQIAGLAVVQAPIAGLFDGEALDLAATVQGTMGMDAG